MRCRDAKQLLSTRRDGDVEQAEDPELRKHISQCPACQAFERRLSCLDHMFEPATPRARTGISTDRIMLAIQQQSRITQQLEDIRAQQQTRVAHMRGMGAALAAIAFFTLGSIPLLLFAIAIIQTDLIVKALSPLNDIIDVVIIGGQYLQEGLTVATRDNWLLSGVAFAVVVMMGMWLRLMRHPQEA